MCAVSTRVEGMRDTYFSGAKLAVISAGKVLAFLRDERTDIQWPGLWDLPGGGREPGETPVDCAIRETGEETGVMLRPSEVVWQRDFQEDKGGRTWFLVAAPGWLCLPAPKLSIEGQAVRWMAVEQFLALPDAVPHMQARLRAYLLADRKEFHGPAQAAS